MKHWERSLKGSAEEGREGRKGREGGKEGKGFISRILLY